MLVVTGSGMVRRGQVQPMLDSFEQNGIRYALQNEMFCEEGRLLLNRRSKYADFYSLRTDSYFCGDPR